MNQAEQPANAADPSRGAKRGAKPKACDTCRPLKTKCAPREGTCGRCIRMGIDCVRSHVQLQQASESAASESSSQQSAEGDDHSADSVGAETVPEQSQEATLIADSTGPETRSNHQDQMAIFPSSSDRGSTPPLSDEDDSEADSEQSHVEAPWTLNSSYLVRDPIPLATIADEVLDFFTRSSSADWSGRTTVVRVTRLEASFHLLISSEAIEFHKGYLAADDDNIVATLFGRQFSDPLQELGYIMRRRELGYKRRSDIIIDNFARSFKSIYDQDVRPSLFSLLFSCKQQPVVPDQVWICIKSDGNIPVGTVFETLPQQGQESQLEQVELDEVTGPDLQLIRKKLWEIYGSSI